ncbi:zf-HC2 domain-containing protein [Sphaerisporangium sp. TRM90804]|uniref:anti-sigma factor family protein n=1 Tax=Sphaerisporangium sp. TRM90804 TaxID=3031113 RepID=UPI002446D46E|nr:zf-HC2 domain-containing protein [Sphaerisporangium sp. TRM90804]MDH2425551.1 zf-HC2 domain-containing protein [Sphaerisporangium sp. TRM90804]
MTGDTHYDLETLAELAEGLLDDPTAARVREHLAVCDPCGESLADLAAVREVLAAVPVPAMPMGVALRIDKALNAEAENRRSGGLRLDETPDWDRIMGDSPWETPVPASVSSAPSHAEPRPLASVTHLLPASVGASAPPEPPASFVPSVPAAREPQEHEEPQVVRLGVVSDDGSVVPAKSRKRERRSWAMPVMASAAAAVVLGSIGLTANMLTATGTGGASEGSIAWTPPSTGPTSAAEQPAGTVDRATTSGSGYSIGTSGYNYSDAVLDGPLLTVFGATGPGSGGQASVDPGVVRCVSRISERVGDRVGRTPKPIGVDKALYLGNEATVMAFWKDRLRNAVWLYVVDSNCRNLRPPTVGRWQ